MPADIRNFFGGKTSTPIREKETKKEADSKKKRSSMMIFKWTKPATEANPFQKAGRLLMTVMMMNLLLRWFSCPFSIYH